MSIKVIITNDGSKSLFLEEMNETYHSKFGASTESEHVYIQSGYLYQKQPELAILEVGFGTGLNVFLTVKAQQKDQRKVYYETIEKFPLAPDIVQQLNDFEQEEARDLFQKIHQLPWEVAQEVVPGFTLVKKQADLSKYNTNIQFDIIYFDAFAPDKQPEMWTADIFKKLFDLLNYQGVLVTYSAKGSVRRTMQSVGFEVARIPGPPGKREMLRAVKK